MFKKIVRALGGDPHKREIDRLTQTVVEPVNRLEEEYEKLSDEQLRERTGFFRERLEQGEALDELMPEAFAAVREASKRTLGLRHYDVQLIGGAVLHEGKVAEMRTGEGKTLAATLALYLNALEGKGVHLVTVNDYLARRDARWMAPIFNTLGMSVGVLQMAARTDGARKAFVVDLERTSPHEDRHQLNMVPRREAYTADITYGTNSEFGFDYLRDNQAIRKEDRVQRGHVFAIIDEVDNILIDEARTPLIISGPASDETEWYVRMAQVVERLRPEDYEVSECDRSVSLTEVGESRVEELLDMPLRDPERPEDITPEQARILGYLEQALRAKHLFKRNKDYLVQSNRVIIIDSSTGRMMPGRRWSEGLHQAVEAKEGVKVNPENVTYATITLQNYYRMYKKLSGMTGTALTESEEFYKIYKLDVMPIPTNLEYVVSHSEKLEELKAKDENGYEYHFYAHKDDSTRTPVFWKRKDFTDVVFRTTEAKLRAIVQEVITLHVIGRPQLVGTTSVENSEILSRRMQARDVRTLLQVLLIRTLWMEANNKVFIDRSNPALAELNAPLEELNPGKLRTLIKDLGINLSMNLEDPENVDRLIVILGLDEEHRERLLSVIKGGIPHMVLNARKHDEESMMIERAGALGAVTIATNMAGRGVDIKLGGELPETVLNDIVRVLENLGHDPYEMTMEERRQVLESIPIDQMSVVRTGSIKAFLDYVRNMEKVKSLGGLHVVGSERYEARRIDNQLRGRAARQGDPGSSRYYLSLEDDLMRLFGGQQVESMWGRVFADDSQPMEMKLLGRIVEQSQERVEGANFDTRKHVLEYDDVLNEQRRRIYAQRDLAFEKEDLTEDVFDMLRTELQARIQSGLGDAEGPWRLIAFLEQVQPTISWEGIVYPSYPVRVLVEEIQSRMAGQPVNVESLRAVMLDLAGRAVGARQEHLLRGAQRLLESAETAYTQQRDERMDLLEVFLEGMRGWEESGQAAPSAAEAANDLSEAVRLPLRLGGGEVRRLMEGDSEVEQALRAQVENHLLGITVKRVLGSLERRFGEELGLQAGEMQGLDWASFSSRVLDVIEQKFEEDHSRLLGESGQITSDLDSVLPRIHENLMDERNLVTLLMLFTQGSRMEFDRRTHQRRTQRYTRLTYTDLVARLVEGMSQEEVTEKILVHLERGLHVLEHLRGIFEFQRLTSSDVTLSQVEEGIQTQLIDKWGLERYEELAGRPLAQLAPEEQAEVRSLVGRRMQNEAYREILVRTISSQWVEYLTQIEALRVSIGMEAYAQRDPLVEYKSKASGMFKELLAEIRMGVISRLFTYRPRRDTGVTVERERPAEMAAQSQAETSAVTEAENKSKKKKRKRH